MTVMTRIAECEFCGGVMKSVWSDGKTRIHSMKCLDCGEKSEMYKRDLKYIEARHFDPFEELDTRVEYDTFVTDFERARRDATNEAFSEPATWRAVKVTLTDDGDYTVAAYEEFAEDGEGVGDDEQLPYGSPDVSWAADSVYVGDYEVKMVPVNGGSAWVYFQFVSSISIETGHIEYIRLRV